MSKKTFFRRAAIAVVTSLGIGILSVPSSQATIVTSSLTLGAATATATTGDTATGSWVARWTYTDSYTVVGDTATVKYTCDAPAAATCPQLEARQTATSDTANIVVKPARTPETVAAAPWVGIQANGWTESATASASGVAARSSVSFKAVNFTTAGTYTYTLFMQGGNNNAVFTGTSTTWTVTVTGPNIAGASIATSYLAPDNAQAAYWRYGNGGTVGANTTSRDSAVVIAAGAATASTLAAVLYVIPANSAGDTSVVVAGARLAVQDTLTATITGAGTISSNSGVTKSSTATMNVSSYAHPTNNPQYQGESLVVYTNGTVGVGTITLRNAANVVVLTRTVTFTGPAASAQVSFSDTYTSLSATDGAGSTNLIARVFDGTTHSTASRLNSGTFYIFSSDTKVVSAGATLYSNAATQYQTSGRCGNTSGQWDTSVLTCALTVADTGTASIYFADSWNVTASSFVTTALTLTVTGGKIVSATVAFDKATYAPGERAVITITAKDRADRVVAGNNAGTFARVYSTPNSLATVTSPASQRGTNGSATDPYGATLTPLASADDGVETRVITMPTYGTTVTYSIEVNGHGVGAANTIVTATATVVDPNATAIAAAEAAAKAAGTAATAAADAATDAALEAIDAANAATDAANLAAEAADAATVAAEEARDAADAATAAVEALATEVATLMAALKAQITTLARTVAKIAKKVNA